MAAEKGLDRPEDKQVVELTAVGGIQAAVGGMQTAVGGIQTAVGGMQFVEQDMQTVEWDTQTVEWDNQTSAWTLSNIKYLDSYCLIVQFPNSPFSIMTCVTHFSTPTHFKNCFLHTPYHKL